MFSSVLSQALLGEQILRSSSDERVALQETRMHSVRVRSSGRKVVVTEHHFVFIIIVTLREQAVLLQVGIRQPQSLVLHLDGEFSRLLIALDQGISFCASRIFPLDY